MEKGPGRVSPAEAAAGLTLNNTDNHTNTSPATNEDKDDS